MRSALAKLAVLGAAEQQLADREQEIVATLMDAAGEEGVAMSLPEIPGGVEDLGGLERLVRWMESRKL